MYKKVEYFIFFKYLDLNVRKILMFNCIFYVKVRLYNCIDVVLEIK